MLNFQYEIPAPRQLTPGTRVRYCYYIEYDELGARRLTVAGTVLEQRSEDLFTLVEFDQEVSWKISYTERVWFFFERKLETAYHLSKCAWLDSRNLDPIKST
jgi:hypothetical protein